MVGGIGLMSIEECVILQTNSLVNYIKESDEKMLNAVRMKGILDERYVGLDKSVLREERHQRYLTKPLHGQFFLKKPTLHKYEKINKITKYTTENDQPVQGWWKQDWTMFCCPYFSMLSTMLFSVVTPDSGSTILLTTIVEHPPPPVKCYSRSQNWLYSVWKYKQYCINN